MNPVGKAGHSSPLGATVVDGGVNFSLFSRSATGVELLLFDRDDDARPARVMRLDPVANRTYHYWHVCVPGVPPGQLYGYRVAGPSDPTNGMRFDPAKVLLDPYGRGVVVPQNYSRDAARQAGDNAATAMKSVVVDGHTYDWEGDTPLQRPSSRTIVYEMHVRGFTRHPSSGVAEKTRGTFAGLIEKIPYLQQLGITAVELLPVFQFDAQDAPPGQVNYWGYAPVAFFAPHQAYSARQDALGPVNEFRDMVKALHRAGIEVILDVVFNHTAEGDQQGPTLSFRGVDNNTYYVKLGQPDWRECSHSMAFTAEIRQEQLLCHLILNAYWEPLDFALPPVDKGGENPWRRWIDTALDSPHDIVPWQTAPSVPGHTYRAEARSVVVLIAGVGNTDRRPSGAAGT